MATSPMEKIFGKGAFEFERKIPGTRPGQENRARYISFDDPDSIPELFHSVVRKIEPPLMKDGGVVLEGARLKLPDGTRLFAGDVSW
ncbi:MAG TPA: hypothetical protein VKC66_31485 [Xanthobacteraceae bacterium]|nr:hypothetical protein [Xanthobacteraceae bacterium]